MTDLNFDGKVAVITGAGGGLGYEHAKLLASRGAFVVINDLGGAADGTGADAGPAERAAQAIRDAGGEAVSDTNSVSTPEGGAGIIKTAVDAYGRVDIVINNAGILRDKSFTKMTPELVDPVIDVHLKGAFNVTKPAFELMKEQGYGRILMTASAAGIFGNFGQTNYGAAKMGLVGLTRVLAVEGAKNNIKCNCIAPIARTRLTEDLLGPLAEKLLPEQVAPVAVWLVHEDVPVSGEVYSVGGGRVARIFIGLTEGFIDPSLSLESVRDNFDKIRNEEGYTVPSSITDETMLLFKALS